MELNPLVEEILQSSESFKIGQQVSNKLKDFILNTFEIYISSGRLRREDIILLKNYNDCLIRSFDNLSIFSNILSNIFCLLTKEMSSNVVPNKKEKSE